MLRELVELHKGDKRYVRRDSEGQFKSEADVGRSLAPDGRSRPRQWPRTVTRTAATSSGE